MQNTWSSVFGTRKISLCEFLFLPTNISLSCSTWKEFQPDNHLLTLKFKNQLGFNKLGLNLRKISVEAILRFMEHETVKNIYNAMFVLTFPWSKKLDQKILFWKNCIKHMRSKQSRVTFWELASLGYAYYKWTYWQSHKRNQVYNYNNKNNNFHDLMQLKSCEKTPHDRLFSV